MNASIRALALPGMVLAAAVALSPIAAAAPTAATPNPSASTAKTTPVKSTPVKSTRPVKGTTANTSGSTATPTTTGGVAMIQSQTVIGFHILTQQMTNTNHLSSTPTMVFFGM